MIEGLLVVAVFTAMLLAIWYAAKVNDMGSCAQTRPIEVSARPLLAHGMSHRTTGA